jgi:hypothetical protein
VQSSSRYFWNSRKRKTSSFEYKGILSCPELFLNFSAHHTPKKYLYAEKHQLKIERIQFKLYLFYLT